MLRSLTCYFHVYISHHSFKKVFVVPNLFVAVEEVFQVFWDFAECAPKGDLKEDNPFPSQLVYDLNTPPSEQALAFYSRYHVEYVKLPDLKYSVKIQQELLDAMNKGEPVCCGTAKVNGVCKAQADKTIIQICQEDLDALKHGVNSWTDTLNIEPVRKDLNDWMSGFGNTGLHDDSELNLIEGDQLLTPVVVSGLAPPDLVAGADKLDGLNLGNLTTDETKLKEGITNAKRMQISGGGTKYEMTMKKIREGAYSLMRKDLVFAD